MICNDCFSFQKSLLNMHQQDQHNCINPFGSLLFSQKWKWSQNSQHSNKHKHTNTQTLSVKGDIITWFQNLNPSEKISCTIINNQKFIVSFLKMVKFRRYDQQYNIYTNKSAPIFSLSLQAQPKSNDFFRLLLSNLKIGCLSDSYLYLSTHQIMDMKMLEWLNQISNNNIFEMAHKVVDREFPQQNLLWFNSESYHKLEAWFANQLEITIIKHFYNKVKIRNPILQLKEYLKKYQKIQECSFLEMTLQMFEKKSDIEIRAINQKLKYLEEKFQEETRIQIFQKIDSDQKNEKNKKKGKKKHCKQKNYKNDQKLFLNQCLQNVTPSKIQQKSQHQQIKISIFQTENKFKQQQFECKETIQEEKIKSIKQVESNLIEIHDKRLNIKDSSLSKGKINKKNLIYVTPKRLLSPVHKKSIYLTNSDNQEEGMMNQKYSDNCKFNISKTQEEKSSDAPLSLDMSNEFNEQSPFNDNKNEQKCKKRKRRRCNKQQELYKQLRKSIMKKVVNKQLNSMIDNLSIETNSMYEMKIISFERVRVFVQSLFPTANALLFGSNAIGLSLPNSDVDIMLLNLPCYSKEDCSQILAHIAVQINAMGWIVSCSTYFNAKVPLVKLQIDPSIHYLNTKRKSDQYHVYNPMALYSLELKNRQNVKTIKVDITINIEGLNSSGYESTILMKEWICKYPCIQRILLVFKYILHNKGYNQNFKGGIGSYCMFVMIAAYIKNGQTQDLDEGELFLSILNFYGEEFDNLTKIISMKEEHPCFFQEEKPSSFEESGKISLLKIIDPITGRIMSSSCYQYNNIKQQFRRIKQEVLQIQDLIQAQLSETNRNAQEIAKLLQNKKGIDKWINKFENKTLISFQNLISGKK